MFKLFIDWFNAPQMTHKGIQALLWMNVGGTLGGFLTELLIK